MKKFTLIFIATFVIQFVNAQNLKVLENAKSILKNSSFNNTKEVDDLIWVQDSLKNFDYNSGTDDWDVTIREKFLQRFPNGRPEFTEQAKYVSNEWLNTYKSHLFYDYSYNLNGNNLDAYIENVWDGNTLSWRSDTLVYENYTKYYNIPNLYGFSDIIVEDKVIYKNWNNSTNQYTGGDKYEITLFSDSLYSIIKKYQYNTTSNEFDLDQKNEFTYDIFNGKNDITLISVQNWDGTTYVNQGQIIFAYVDNNMVQKTEQNWNSSTSSWENSMKTERTYDVNNYVSSELTYDWDGTSWVKDDKYIFQNDAIGNILLKEEYSWDAVNSQWNGYRKYEYTYNTDNFILTKTKSHWDVSDWEYSWKEMFEYNSNNEETYYLYQSWTGTEFVNFFKISYSFDVFGNIAEILYQDWDGTGLEWINNSRDIYNYDLNQNLTEKLMQGRLGNSWLNSYKTEYYWSEFNATIVEGSQNSYFNIYPNPTSDVINVNNTKNNISSIIITNVSGKVVYKNNKLNSQNNFIKMKKYGAGIYLLNIKDVNGNEISSKVLVK